MALLQDVRKAVDSYKEPEGFRVEQSLPIPDQLLFSSQSKLRVRMTHLME